MRGAARLIAGLKAGVSLLFLVWLCHPAVGATCGNIAATDFRIVLDVGHTAAEPGAISARGVPEYYFNLNLARQIERELIGAGFVSTQLLVTQVVGQPGLRQRSGFANRIRAHLFLSVHHDSPGAEYKSDWVYEGTKQRHSDEFRGFSLFISRRNDSYAASLRFAKAIADRLLSSGLEFTTLHEETNPAGARRPYADRERGIYINDALSVLMFSGMPAVLLEAGVITNRNEERLLSSPARQVMIAKAVTAAVLDFCGNRRTD